MTNEEEMQSFDVLERHLCDVFKPAERRFRATVLPEIIKSMKYLIKMQISISNIHHLAVKAFLNFSKPRIALH